VEKKKKSKKKVRRKMDGNRWKWKGNRWEWKGKRWEGIRMDIIGMDGNGKQVRGTDENEKEWMERKRKGNRWE
jgi:hypothetical protein